MPRRRQARPRRQGQKPELSVDAGTKVRKKGNVYYLFHENRRRIPWKLIIALVIVFIGAMGSAFSYAQLHRMQREVDISRRNYNNQQLANRNLEALVTRNYTREEIEYLASERLGMSAPDPSQIIYFHVPHQSGVLMTTYIPQEPMEESSSWQGIVAMFRSIRSRLFN